MAKKLTSLDEQSFCHRCDNNNKNMSECESCIKSQGSMKLSDHHKNFRPFYSRTLSEYNLLEALELIKNIDPNNLNCFDTLKTVCLGLVNSGRDSKSNKDIVDKLSKWDSFIYKQGVKYQLNRTEIRNIIRGQYYFKKGPYDRERNLTIISGIIKESKRIIEENIDYFKVLDLKDMLNYHLIENKRIEVYIKKEFSHILSTSKIPSYIMKELKDKLSDVGVKNKGGLLLSSVKNKINIGHNYNDKIHEVFKSIGLQKLEKTSILKYIIKQIKELNGDIKFSVMDLKNKKIDISKLPESVKNRYVKSYYISEKEAIITVI
jgi:hypothetical protein